MDSNTAKSNLSVNDSVEINTCGITVEGRVKHIERDDDFSIEFKETKTEMGFNILQCLFALDKSRPFTINKKPKRIGGIYGKRKYKKNSARQEFRN